MGSNPASSPWNSKKVYHHRLSPPRPQLKLNGIAAIVRLTALVFLVAQGSGLLSATPSALAIELSSVEYHPVEPAGSMVYPLVSTRVSSKFGIRVHPVIHKQREHKGLDLAAPSNAPVRAIQSGRVVFADPLGGYGNLIVIQHSNGLTSHYGHLHDIRAKLGTVVSAGEVIGSVGSTGRVTGPHLHFEIRKNGAPLDPLKLFPEIANRGEG
ncbi:MAG: M23 family metallopeptidase [Bdellovibrionales bacterium]|nr:M23 family metallopeptidase [Bdellovibrionales bacterium]